MSAQLHAVTTGRQYNHPNMSV